jgi:hypothetical protein
MAPFLISACATVLEKKSRIRRAMDCPFLKMDDDRRSRDTKLNSFLELRMVRP